MDSSWVLTMKKVTKISFIRQIMNQMNFDFNSEYTKNSEIHAVVFLKLMNRYIWTKE